MIFLLKIIIVFIEHVMMSYPVRAQYNRINAISICMHTYWMYVGQHVSTALLILNIKNTFISYTFTWTDFQFLAFQSLFHSLSSLLQFLLCGWMPRLVMGKCNLRERKCVCKISTRTKHSMFPVLPSYHLLPDYFDNWLERRRKKGRRIMPAMRIKDIVAILLQFLNEKLLLYALTACLGSAHGTTSLSECLIAYRMKCAWVSEHYEFL